MPANYDNDLVLVTLASGKQGADLVPHLYGKWKRIRLQVLSEKSKDRLSKQYPDAEVVQADMTDLQSCNKLLDGVSCCFLNGPGFGHRETSSPTNVIDAANAQRNAGGPFVHILYSSVLHTQIRKLLNHDSKRYNEERLIESSLLFTILQPTHLNETLPVAKLLSEEHPVYPAAWNPNTLFSFCTTKDLGEAAARILEQRERHYYATYECVSTTEPITYTRAIEIVSKEIGKEITIRQRSLEEATEVMADVLTGGNVNSEIREGVGRMFMYYNERGLVGNSNVLRMLLGREPMTYEQWAKMKVQEVREQ